VRRREGKGRRRGYCVAARGGARGSTQRVFVRRRRGNNGMQRRRGCVRRGRRDNGMRRRRGCYVCARCGACGSAKSGGGGGALRRVARPQQILLLRGTVSVPQRPSDSARFGSQTRYVRRLASRSRTGIADGVVFDYRRGLLKGAARQTRARAASNSFESLCCVADFVVNSEPHSGARPSVGLCVGPELVRCVHS
jgi:hypothetical protein